MQAIAFLQQEPVSEVMRRAGITAIAGRLVGTCSGGEQQRLRFMGFLVPSENVMQFAGPAMAIMAMFGGIFMPVSALPPTVKTLATWSPMYGVGQLARGPLGAPWDAFDFVRVAAWALVFGLLAMWLFRRDTARV